MRYLALSEPRLARKLTPTLQSRADLDRKSALDDYFIHCALE